MSEGPIKREREAWEPKRVTTKPAESVHMAGRKSGHGYCGRRAKNIAFVARNVTCSDCLAALEADNPGGRLSLVGIERRTA